MKSSREIAGWILELLGLDVALAGDLQEERARGRSAIWYWRQVLVAGCIGVWRAIFSHKLLALRSVATGYAVNSIWFVMWSQFPRLRMPTKPMAWAEWIVGLLIILLTQATTGWVVARTHRAYPFPMVVVLAVWLTLWAVVGDLSYIRMLVVDSIDQPRFRPYLVWHLTPIFIVAAGLLLGGIVGTGLKRQRTPTLNSENV